MDFAAFAECMAGQQIRESAMRQGRLSSVNEENDSFKDSSFEVAIVLPFQDRLHLLNQFLRLPFFGYAENRLAWDSWQI